ncbi:MAG: radical SAM protein [Candidatus Omnitrophica bacterium]|nr:radical SAM protein [Candidatus Omnitrophota bacterium]
MKTGLSDAHRLMMDGIKNGRKAFRGPHTAQIDLTDRCNNNCIGCWVHSPFIEKRLFFKKERELPFSLVKKVINELHQLGTKEIFLSGSGEPFLYPNIREVIGLIKSSQMRLNIITNATLIDKDFSEMLIDLKVDLITASIWAGSADTYVATHPGKNRSDFEKVKGNLNTLAFYKRRFDSYFPHVKIYNVICSRNYDDLEQMVDFAREVNADSVEFQVVDTVEKKTGFLALGETQAKKIFDQFGKIRKSKEMVYYQVPEDCSISNFKENESLDPGKLWKDYKEGFKLSRYAEKIVCPKGHELPKKEGLSEEADKVTEAQTFKYRFSPREECPSCEFYADCFKEADKKTIDANLLNILNMGTFLRRLSDCKKESIYDIKVDSIPCYVGWYYSRILSDGSVIPCCKASKFPLGNIHRNSFSSIWNSYRYKKFRFNAKNLSKKDPYFSRIDCLKSCDNWGMNLQIYRDTARGDGFWACKTRVKREKKKRYIEIMAKDFTKSNLNPDCHDFGKDIVIDGGRRSSYAVYDFFVPEGGKFNLYSKYAAKDFRPVSIFLDDRLIKETALSVITGGWTREYLMWNKEAEIDLNAGRHRLKIESQGVVPHIERFTFTNGAGLFFADRKRKIGANYISALKNNITSNGLIYTAKKVKSNLNAGYLKERYLEVLGIYDGRKGYKGPFHVQIDLTNNCNNRCIACWCNSPLLREKRLSDRDKKQYLPLGLAKELINDISHMGATEVYLSGSGEPFMHPQIIDILKHIKGHNLICHVNTNFTLLTKERLDCLMDIGVDFLTVSTWAATPRTYIKTHANRTEEDFYRIKENLIYLNTHKRDKPRIKLYNVIFNMNYFEVEEMVRFAARTRSESLEFTLVDTIPDATDILALNKRELSELKDLCIKIKLGLDANNRTESGDLLLFQFGQFLRRISVAEDVKEARYDRNIVDKMPCYIGWLFARIVPNGEVHSCLKAHRIPTGSLYLNRFSEIWNSERQAHFRKKTCVYVKDDPFFRVIGNDPDIKEAGCYKSCDDIGRNTWMHKRIKMLSPPERLILKGIAKTLKFVKKVNPKRADYKRYNKDPVIAGILHGRKALAGPEQVVIDPTNKCNLRCLSCWLYSPLLTKDRPSKDCLKEEIPKDVMIKLIDELSDLGTKRIRFTGGGEPFMHKGLMDVIEHARSKDLLVAITTNFGLVSRRDITRLVNLGLEELCVSIWAGCADSYCRVHPGTTPAYFKKLKENLFYLKKIKKDRPRLTFSNVIMNTNCNDLEEMYGFALQHGADSIYFTLVDTIRGQTDRLLLNENERRGLLNKASEIKKRSMNNNIELEFFDGFLRRLSSVKESSKTGEYDRQAIDKIPCYAGWIFSRVLANGDVAPCCRGVRKAMGNIREKSFKDIWISSRYDEFRAKAKFLSKRDDFFKEIGCVKECDNLMHNEQMHKIICRL